MTDNTQLSKHHCVPCEGGTQPLTRQEFTVYLDQVKEWSVVQDKMLTREFTFKNFKEVVAFVNQIADIADIAEAEGHHPDLYIHDYKMLKVSLTTFAIGGLSINDFVMATKIDELKQLK